MKLKLNLLITTWVLSQLLGSFGITALAGSAPICYSFNGQALPINDNEVLVWKATTANQTLERAHVGGYVTRIFNTENGHQHFEITIGPNQGDTLEVVSNIDFGVIQNLSLGVAVEACGDYITSNQSTPRYPVSPDNAIIHWVHVNPSGHGHPNGYTIVGGVLYGQGPGR